jgi:hypothetical protein
MIEQTFEDGDLCISLRDESEESARTLYARALTYLIEEADIHGWEKEAIEEGGDPRALEHFCCDVLAALARSYTWEADLYKPDGDPTKDAPQSLGDVLREVTARLKEADMLDLTIVPAGGDGDYEDFLDEDDDSASS